MLESVDPLDRERFWFILEELGRPEWIENRGTGGHDMLTLEQAEAFIADHRVTLVRKADSRLMRAIGWLLTWFVPEFMDRFWTTIGRTIYYPCKYESVRNLEPFLSTLEHEFIHVRQWERWWLWYSVSYLLFPLPVGLAWFRWRWEREAYLPRLKRFATGPEVDRIVDSLWSNYLWPWPPFLMRRWFCKQVGL